MFMPARRRAPSISTFFVLGPIVQMIELRGRAGCEPGCSLQVLAACASGALEDALGNLPSSGA
jgi:hypothetical protein